MEKRRISALALAIVMIVGLLPIVPQNMKSVEAATIKNVVRSISGITEPADGWDSNFTSQNFCFAKDTSVDGSQDIHATQTSIYQKQPDQWIPTIKYSTSSVNVKINSAPSQADGGSSYTVSLTGYSNIQFKQTSGMIYNESTNEVAAYGRIGDATVGSKIFTMPAGMPVGTYKLWIFFERFDVNGTDQIVDIGTVTFTLNTSGEVTDTHDVTINWTSDRIKRLSGERIQLDHAGEIIPVVFTVSDTQKYYFPTNYASIGTYDGISVIRNSGSRITVSGTPKDDVIINLEEPSVKATQNEPDVAGGVLVIQGTDTTMEYSSDKNGTYTTCDPGSTAVDAGTWYVRYKDSEDKQAGEAKQITVTSPAAKYYVILNNASNGNMTRLTSSGAESQQNLTGEMKPVVYNANSGYYFPDTYPLTVKNGISITRNSPTQITVSGIPTGNTSIDITAASVKPTPEAPDVKAGAYKIIGTTTQMQYSDSSSPNNWYPCDDEETLVSAGIKNVRYKETSSNKAGKITQIEVTDGEEEEEEEEPNQDGYTVSIINPAGSNITIASETENLYYQTGIKGAMKQIIYYADAEYYFPSSYKGILLNGVRVLRSGSRMLTISGTPTADTVITLNPAISINTPLYSVTVLNGSGDDYYMEGVSVEITADEKDGQSFSGWRVSQGGVTLANSKSKTTTFTMPSTQVVLEALYSNGASADNGSGNTGTTNTSGSTGGTNTGSANSDTANSGGSAGSNSNSGGTANAAPLSQKTIAKNSKTLDISAKAVWSSSNNAWKITWNSVSGAAGYDVLVAQGSDSLKLDASSPSLSGNSSTTAYIKTFGGKAIDKSKTYKFRIKAYRVVNNGKDYIGTSRPLYVAGPNNKTYTNIKVVKPVKKTLKIKKGKTAKIQTAIKKQKSSKKLMSNSAGKKFNYISSDTSIATVSNTGKVRGVKKGTCTIYVVAQNGIRTTVKIKVK